MNKRMSVNEQALVEQATHAVGSLTGLTFNASPWPSHAGRRAQHVPDCALSLFRKQRPIEFAVECKLHITGASQLGLIKQHMAMWDVEARPLLVTQHMPPRLIDHCREIDLDFIDVGGNCLIRASPIWIMIRGNKPPADAMSVSRRYQGSATYAALRLIYALLCTPELLSASYREMASASGVSVGSVAMILADLEERGMLSPRDSHKRRRLLDATRLESEWATNYPNKLRPRLGIRRFSASSQDWWRHAEIGPNAYWGGEVAAFRLSGYLRPETQTIYVDEALASDTVSRLVRQHRLRADPKGPIEILDAFWTTTAQPSSTETVSPLLVYADLLGIKDSRAQEAASMIRKEFLHA
jgi:hypothetical protein